MSEDLPGADTEELVLAAYRRLIERASSLVHAAAAPAQDLEPEPDPPPCP